MGSDILFGPLAARTELTGKDMGSRNHDGTGGRRRGCEAKTISCKASIEEQTVARHSWWHAAAGNQDANTLPSLKPCVPILHIWSYSLLDHHHKAICCYRADSRAFLFGHL